MKQEAKSSQGTTSKPRDLIIPKSSCFSTIALLPELCHGLQHPHSMFQYVNHDQLPGLQSTVTKKSDNGHHRRVPRTRLERTCGMMAMGTAVKT